MSAPSNQPVAQSRPLPKVLRIGLVQEGKIVQERLMKVGESVFVGTGPKNTFELAGPGVPARLELFSSKGNAHYLTVTETIAGKLQWKDGIKDLDDLRKTEAQKKGDLFQIPINEESKGKVVVGTTTVLFQFVNAPPEPLKVVAPADVKGGFLDEDDPLFLGLLMVFSFFAGVFMLWIHLTPVQEEDPLAMIDRAADLMVETIVVPPPPAPTEVPTDNGDKKTPEKAAASQDKPKSAPTADASKSAVAEHSLLIQAIGDNGSGAGLAADLLGDDAASMANLSQALAGASGTQSATAANVGGVRGGNGNGIVDGHVEVGTAGGGANGVGTTGAVVVRKARVDTSEGDLDVEEGDASGVSGVIKRNSGRITACTETALKSNPNVKGRISVTWHIDKGRVVGAQVVGNQTGDSTLADCVLRQVRAFRFDAGVTATVDQYTWIVSAQ